MTNPKVFDVVYPSPIPLRELSSIAVAYQLWHLDLNQYLENGNLSEEFHSGSEAEPRITLRDVIPNIPLLIHRMTGEYLKILVASTSDWLTYHFDRIFRFDRHNHNVILKDFNDIVCDYDGTIDYTRTAKRMMLCDRISPDEKFKIACAYSFEEYIKLIGPSVQSNVDLDVVDFNLCPHLYYWICYLRNKMDEIPNERDMPIDDLMLKKTKPENRSSFEYFWNRASPESRHRKAVKLCGNDGLSFCGRFVLPKLSEQQLTAFLAEKGGDLVYYLGVRSQNKEHIFPIWMYVKDKIDEANFTSMVERMLRFESYYFTINNASVEKLYDPDNEIVQIWCEILKSAPESLKKMMLKNILQHEGLFKINPSIFLRPSESRFLRSILSEATSQERTTFWLKNWPNLIVSTRVSDLDRIMNLCFINKTEIHQFKTTTMAKYENLIKLVENSMFRGFFKESADLLDFCILDPHACADLKRQFLRSHILKEDNFVGIITKFQSFNDFIDDAYADSPELASDFRNELMSSAFTERSLLSCIQSGLLVYVKPFVESFELIGHNMDQMKKQLVDALREFLIEGSVWRIKAKHVQDFVLWCLGSDDRVTEFKRSISPEDVLSGMLNFQPSLYTSAENLDQFLLWYFVTPQKIDEFKTRFPHALKMFESLSD